MLRVALIASLLAAVVGRAQPSRPAADVKAEKAEQARVCFEAYETTQGARRDGKLMVAREAAIVCAADVCPKTLSRDCAKWVGELQAIVPGLVFDVRIADGSNLTDVAVFLDDKPLVSKVDGKSVPVDPGEHLLRFEARDFLPLETRVVALEGDKARKVLVTLKRPDAIALEPAAVKKHRPVPASTWVFASVGAAALVTSGVLGLVGLVNRSALEACKPNCDPTRAQAVARTFGFADGLLVAGVVAAGAALFTFFTRPEVPLIASLWLGDGPGVIVRWVLP
jgi:hypothetical protein